MTDAVREQLERAIAAHQNVPFVGAHQYTWQE